MKKQERQSYFTRPLTRKLSLIERLQFMVGHIPLRFRRDEGDIVLKTMRLRQRTNTTLAEPTTAEQTEPLDALTENSDSISPVLPEPVSKAAEEAMCRLANKPN